MGVVRLLLAFAVVVSHAGFAGWVSNSRIAVQCFFMISGFLISFVLNKDGGYSSPTKFYLNRALRIYPVYWTVAAVTICLLFLSPKANQFHSLNSEARAVLVVSNLAIFGQDAVMFLQQTTAGLEIALDFKKSNPALWRFLLIPPAWSLALELTFYLLAPFIVRRLRLTITLALFSLGLTAVGLYYGLSSDPWTYRFFPFEISLFLIGVLAERLLLAGFKNVRMVNASPGMAAAAILAYPVLIVPEPLRSIVVLGTFAFLLPFLFRFQNGRRWDVFVGDLSYPLYIGHWIVISVVNKFSELQAWPDPLRGSSAIIGALLLAVALERTIARPVEGLRKRVRRQAAPVDLLEAKEFKPHAGDSVCF